MAPLDSLKAMQRIAYALHCKMMQDAGCSIFVRLTSLIITNICATMGSFRM